MAGGVRANVRSGRVVPNGLTGYAHNAPPQAVYLPRVPTWPTPTVELAGELNDAVYDSPVTMSGCWEKREGRSSSARRSGVGGLWWVNRGRRHIRGGAGGVCMAVAEELA